MENLPENEFVDQLGNRLRHYHEEPDSDLWDKIAAVAPSAGRMVWAEVIDHGTTFLSICILVFALSTGELPVNELAQKSANQHEITTESKSNAEANITHKLQASESSFTSFQEATKSSLGSKRGASILFARDSSFRKQGIQSASSNQSLRSAMLVKDFDQISHLNVIAKIADSTSTAIQSPKNIDVVLADSSWTAVAKKVDSPVHLEPVIIPSRSKRKFLTAFASLTPSLSYYDITPYKSDGTIITRFQSASVVSVERLGFKGEVGVQQPLSNRIELFAGLSYFQQDQSVQYENRIIGEAPTILPKGDMAFEIIPMLYTTSISYNMKNIGAEIGFLYELNGGLLSQKVGAGLHYQHGLQRKAQNGVYDNSQSQYLSYQLLYRNEYAFSNQLKIYVQPSFSYAVIANEKSDAPFRVTPYTVSFTFGVILQLTRKAK